MSSANLEEVLPIFDSVQQSKRTHKQSGKKLSQFFQGLSASVKEQTLIRLLRSIFDQALLVPKSSVYVDRVLDFFALFFAQSTEDFHVLLINHLSQRISSTNKLVRQRACDIMKKFLEYASQFDVELSEEVFRNMQVLLLSRLRDKIVTVRNVAIETLKFLQNPEDLEDEVIAQLCAVLQRDTNASTRKLVVDTLALTEQTKLLLIERLQDVKLDVRIAVLRRFLAETDVRQFTKPQRLSILALGLQSRSEEMQLETERLLLKWCALLQHDAIKLLTYLYDVDQQDVLVHVIALFCERIYSVSNASFTEEQLFSVQNMKAIKFNWEVFAQPAKLQFSEQLCVEVLFLYLKLKYAQLSQNTFQFMNLLEDTLPDLDRFLSFLQHVDKVRAQAPANNSLNVFFVYKQLVSFCSLFLCASDITGSEQIESFIVKLFFAGPVEGQEEVSSSYLDTLHAIHVPSSSSSLASDRNEVAKGEKKLMLKLVSFLERDDLHCSLQVIFYLFSRPSLASLYYKEGEQLFGAQGREQQGSAMHACLLTGLQDSCIAMRSLAMQGLGVYSVSLVQHISLLETQERNQLMLSLTLLKNISLFQTVEVEEVRSLALRGLVDCCLLSTSLPILTEGESDTPLGQLVQGVQTLLSPLEISQGLGKVVDYHSLLHAAGGYEDFAVLGVEQTVKLLFHGFFPPSAGASGVLLHLVKHFFIPVEGKGEGMERVQQLLSLFFSTYLTTPLAETGEGERRGRVSPCVEGVCEALSLFIADFTTHVRDGFLEAKQLSLALGSLFGILSSSLPSPPTSPHALSLLSSLHALYLSSFGNLAKELLKLGDLEEKGEKSLGREYLKFLLSLPAFPLTEEEREVVERVVEEVQHALSPCSSLQTLSRNLGVWVKTTLSLPPLEAEGEEGENRLTRWCCGLSDLLQVNQSTWNDERDRGAEEEEEERAGEEGGEGGIIGAEEVEGGWESDDATEEEEEAEESEEEEKVSARKGKGGRASSAKEVSKGEKAGDLGRSSRRAMLAGKY